MSFIDRILGKDEKTKQVINAGQTFKMVSAYAPVFTDWRGEIYESLLVRAAIDARSRHISKLKIEFLGTAKPDLVAKLKRRPNPWNSWSQFMYRVNTILDCCNNAIIVPIYDADLNKIGVFPLLPSSCKVVIYKDDYWLRYTFLDDRNTAACKLSECAILTKFQFKNDFFGSTNTTLDGTMDLIEIQRQGIKEAIKSTAGYKFMAKFTNFTKQADLDKERESFSEAAFGKEAKKTGVLIFPNTYQDIKQVDIKPWTPDKDQMDYINQHVFDYFGVNQDILQNKASGDQWSAFFEGAVEPFSIQFSETMTAALFSEREISLGAEVLATANRIQYMNFNDKLNYVTGMSDRGLIMIDEAREVFNLASLPDGKGQVFPRRGEYAMLDPDTGKDLNTKEGADLQTNPDETGGNDNANKE